VSYLKYFIVPIGSCGEGLGIVVVEFYVAQIIEIEDVLDILHVLVLRYCHKFEQDM
jgi:hypothetical protein